MYATIAWAAGHALQRAAGRQTDALAASLATNLVLNPSWNRLFFRRRNPRAALVGGGSTCRVRHTSCWPGTLCRSVPLPDLRGDAGGVDRQQRVRFLKDETIHWVHLKRRLKDDKLPPTGIRRQPWQFPD
ncbi:tryptophan-rich sensory protein [Streptomyces fagopyri]|uniref:tryptophan-rich sensory protein n=1 Tax=Streptomyces fagopyri TaxID=2662397 RepID=UPI00367A0DDD